jgi:hypothetical protein
VHALATGAKRIRAKNAIPARCRFDDPKIIVVIVHAFSPNAKSAQGAKNAKRGLARDKEAGCVSGIRPKT